MTSPAEHDHAMLKRAFEQTPNLFSLLATLRTRRMGLGYRNETGEEETFTWAGGQRVVQPAGPLAWTSATPAVPLHEVEEALIAWAGVGPNGLALADIGVQGALGGLLSAIGRTIPSSSNDLSVDLLIVNDDGVWRYRPTPDDPSPIEIAGPDDYGKILDWYRNGRELVDPHRPDVGWRTSPEGTHNVNAMGPGQYNLNRPGSTWFLPVGDVGLEWFNLLLSSYEWSGFYLMDPDTAKPAGCDQWIRPGFCEVGFPIPVFDELALMLHASQAACAVQNIRLAAEALGLGAWPVGSYADDLLLGAYPEVARGLGFSFLERDAARNPSKTVTCIGRPGVLEPVVVPSPQFPTAADAVAYVRERRYRSGGPLSEDTPCSPYRDEVRRDILDDPRSHVADWAEHAAIDTVEYIVERYGCCPAFVSPVRAKFSVQVHHVDADFYARFDTPAAQGAAITPAIADHFEHWHPGVPDPTASLTTARGA